LRSTTETRPPASTNTRPPKPPRFRGGNPCCRPFLSRRQGSDGALQHSDHAKNSLHHVRVPRPKNELQNGLIPGVPPPPSTLRAPFCLNYARGWVCAAAPGFKLPPLTHRYPSSGRGLAWNATQAVHGGPSLRNTPAGSRVGARQTRRRSRRAVSPPWGFAPTPR
jgi:hypothetical protein